MLPAPGHQPSAVPDPPGHEGDGLQAVHSPVKMDRLQPLRAA
jgi:hypothetical protein